MLTCRLPELKRVLCLGAHSDDIEIGCGGTILKLLRERRGLEFSWHVFSAEGERRQEAARSARLFLEGAQTSEIRIGHYRESYFPAEWAKIKDAFEQLKAQFEPDLVFTHRRADEHQDHRVISELTWNTFRNHTILEYEIPKYEGDLGQPGVFVELDHELAERKAGAIMDCFATQRSRHWFTTSTFLGLMRLRGIECASNYAEAFYCRKLKL